MILDKVNTPDDLKKLSLDEMNYLSDEIRELIIKKVNATGGHMAPNLGIIEATIAMHYVFNSPVDKIVFDVSHQCYPHKILTGRKEGFTDPDKYLKYTGYTAPEESEHDLFKVGHTSTAASLATGLAKARDLKGEKSNVIAIVGDGSLSGGEALEGLDNAAALGSNIIIVINILNHIFFDFFFLLSVELFFTFSSSACFCNAFGSSSSLKFIYYFSSVFYYTLG